MKYIARTDKGRVRETNEDSYNVISGKNGDPSVFIIADVIGGHNSGEVASKIATDYVSDAILPLIIAQYDDDHISEIIKNVIQQANKAVHDKSLEDIGNHGMGTTLTIAVAANQKMYIGHVGDSRMYLIRDGLIKRITTDHSYIEELLQSGGITKEEAERHPNRNLITRALGYAGQLDVDTYICDIRDRDKFLLCTDGLTNMVDESEIKRIIAEVPENTCDALIDYANRNGGEDNITAIIIRNE